ncbi:MAG TPA: ankyrin repeat domain-containing protein, partial [Longimicrobiales bacterium]|nr:ankyrin repeat domain-containing protein [Longimicrobiales bacterium]
NHLSASPSTRLSNSKKDLENFRPLRGDSLQHLPAFTLLEAAKAHDLVSVRNMIAGGASVDEVDSSLNTPLHIIADSYRTASWPDDVEIARMLLDAGLDVNSRNANAATPLHEALRCAGSFGGNVELIKLLVDHGADCHTPDCSGFVPLQFHILGSLDIPPGLTRDRINTIASEHKKNLAAIRSVLTRANIGG